MFISHDLSVVRHVSDRIAVMYLGKIVEVAADRGAATSTPATPTPARCCRPCPSPTRTRSTGRERVVLRGDLPSPADAAVGLPVPPAVPQGAGASAAPTSPELCRARRPGTASACHFPLADGELLTLSKPTIDDLAPDLTFDPTAAEEGTS